MWTTKSDKKSASYSISQLVVLCLFTGLLSCGDSDSSAGPSLPTDSPDATTEPLSQNPNGSSTELGTLQTLKRSLPEGRYQGFLENGSSCEVVVSSTDSQYSLKLLTESEGTQTELDFIYDRRALYEELHFSHTAIRASFNIIKKHTPHAHSLDEENEHIATLSILFADDQVTHIYVYNPPVGLSVTQANCLIKDYSVLNASE